MGANPDGGRIDSLRHHVIVGGIIGFMQINSERSSFTHLILLVSDSLVALALGAAAIACASLGTTNYVLLRETWPQW